MNFETADTLTAGLLFRESINFDGHDIFQHKGEVFQRQ